MGAAMQMTVEQYAELYGKRTDAVQKKLRQKFAGERFALDSELSPEHIAELSVDGRRSKRANIARKVLAETSPKVREKLQRYYDTATPEQVVEDMQAIGSDLVDFAPKEKPQPKHRPAPEPEWVEIVVDKPAPEPEPEEEQWTQEQERPFYQRALLVCLLVAPTAASVTNMYKVTGDITGEPITAALYTVVLSITALGFTLSGIRSWVTVALAVVLIGYESFCNLTRLYYGLMGGVTGNPTRFLGTVTSIFESGSHGTAIVIAAFSAVMLAAVQYTAILEINRHGK
jgi:hypothetical protein